MGLSMRGDVMNCAPPIYEQCNSSSAVTEGDHGLTVYVNPPNQGIRQGGELRAGKWEILDGKAKAAVINGRKHGLCLPWMPQN